MDTAGLPSGLSGKESELAQDDLNEIENLIIESKRKTDEYVEKKRQADASLRSFVRGTLADTCKLAPV